MNLDKLVGNLKTYEMNVDETKMSWRNKDLIFSSKATESDESDLDDEDISMISENLKNLFKKGGNYEKKLPPCKEKESGNDMHIA